MSRTTKTWPDPRPLPYKYPIGWKKPSEGGPKSEVECTIPPDLGPNQLKKPRPTP